MSEKPKLAETKDTYTQQADCCQDNDGLQFLEVRSMDGGGGHYIVIATERWAIDDIDEFCATLKQTLERMERGVFEK